MTEPRSFRLGKYEILEEIGRGGFATVYRALDTTLDRGVALKVLHPQLLTDPAFVARFQREARALANLRHPHIVTVYEVAEAEGRLFVAMELARGPSLAQAIAERGRFPWAETLATLQPVCEALDYAHGQGVVHRDLKPANILLDAERGPLLSDFGFARLLSDSSASLSLSGGILGTPAYIGPEVWELDAALPAADGYALACIVYEMLTGQVLFGGTTPMQVMHAHDRGPQFPDAWPPDVPAGVAGVLSKGLAREPGSRYPSAGALWYALNDLAAQEQAARAAAERAAVAAQWRAEAERAMGAGEWSAARMAVGRWLAAAPQDAAAQAARRQIEQHEAQAPDRVQPWAKVGEKEEAAVLQEARQEPVPIQADAADRAEDAGRRRRQASPHGIKVAAWLLLGFGVLFGLEAGISYITTHYWGVVYRGFEEPFEISVGTIGVIGVVGAIGLLAGKLWGCGIGLLFARLSGVVGLIGAVAIVIFLIGASVFPLEDFLVTLMHLAAAIILSYEFGLRPKELVKQIIWWRRS